MINSEVSVVTVMEAGMRCPRCMDNSVSVTSSGQSLGQTSHPNGTASGYGGRGSQRPENNMKIIYNKKYTNNNQYVHEKMIIMQKENIVIQHL